MSSEIITSLEPSFEKNFGIFSQIFNIHYVNEHSLKTYEGFGSYESQDNKEKDIFSLQNAIKNALTFISEGILVDLYEKIDRKCEPPKRIGNRSHIILTKEPKQITETTFIVSTLPEGVKSVLFTEKPYLYLWRSYPDVVCKVEREGRINKMHFKLLAAVDLVGEAYIQ